MAAERDSNVETAVTFNGDQAMLQVDTRDDNGRYLNDISMTANVIAPDGTVNNVVLPQIAPGRYGGEFTPTQDGAYFLRINGDDSDGESVVGQTSGWVLGYSAEYQPTVPETNVLTLLSENHGGQDLSEEITAVFEHNLVSESVSRPIWPWLILAAVLLLPFDIAVRRLVITKRDWQRAWAASFGRLFPQPAAPTTQTEQVSRLFQAKKRAATRHTQEESDSVQEESVPATFSEEIPTKIVDVSTAKTSQKTPAKSSDSTRNSDSLASRLLDKKQQRDQE